MTTAMPRSLRADAADNRDRVLEAARELFASADLSVPMHAIAARAGVATATLYRRFPTKRTLVEEVFAEQLRACTTLVLRAVEDPDPWRAFTGLIERVLVLNARNRGFVDAFLSAYPDAFDPGAHRSRMLAGIADVATRAIAAGRLRPDFAVADFVLVVLAGRGLTAAPVEDPVAASRRFAALAIDGLRRAEGDGALPARPRLVPPVVEP
jgi:AcrR family transcriptional regulator